MIRRARRAARGHVSFLISTVPFISYYLLLLLSLSLSPLLASIYYSSHSVSLPLSSFGLNIAIKGFGRLMSSARSLMLTLKRFSYTWDLMAMAFLLMSSASN